MALHCRLDGNLASVVSLVQGSPSSCCSSKLCFASTKASRVNGYGCSEHLRHAPDEMTREMSTTSGRRLAILAGALAGSLSAFAYARYRRDLRRAHQRVSTGSEVVQTACGPIEYAVAGDGPPALIVHGAGGGFDQGMEFGEALADNGFRIIAMSRFGYLRTPLPSDASSAAQADAHACLLDALGIERAAIIGASAGAPSSLQFALRHPQRCSALVLVVPAAYAPRLGGAPPLQTPPWTEALFDTALRSDFLY